MPISTILEVPKTLKSRPWYVCFFCMRCDVDNNTSPPQRGAYRHTLLRLSWVKSRAWCCNTVSAVLMSDHCRTVSRCVSFNKICEQSLAFNWNWDKAFHNKKKMTLSYVLYVKISISPGKHNYLMKGMNYLTHSLPLWKHFLTWKQVLCSVMPQKDALFFSLDGGPVPWKM